MIIELWGVPGGGKSTFAKTYSEIHPRISSLVSISMYNRWPVVWYAGLFIIFHPFSFISLVRFVFRHHMQGLFWYSFHLVLRACAKYQKASFYPSSQTVFIDEGLIHVLSVLPDSVLSEHQLSTWLRSVILPDISCVTETGDFHRFHSDNVNIHPRVKQGETALAAWESAVRSNVPRAVSCLKKMQVPMWNIPDKSLVVGEKSVYGFHQYIQTHTV